MSTKQRAFEIYQQHIELARTDGRLFRKTVMDQLIAETGCSVASAATQYNNAKKAMPVEGLGRAAPAKGVRKLTAGRVREEELVPDNECFSVLELLPENNIMAVGRQYSFLHQADAIDAFDAKTRAWPRSTWVMMQGLGPNSGEAFRLDTGEKEIKRYVPA